MKRGRTTLALLLKALVSLGLLFFLLTRIEPGQLLRALSSARLSYLGVALIAYFAGQVVSSIRWVLLARPLDFRNRYTEFATFYFIGMFFNLFAPGIIGGDVGRVFYLARDRAREEHGWTAPTVRALATVIADRAVGITVLVWIGAAALALYPGYPVPWTIRYALFALALGLLGGWISLPLLSRLVKTTGHRMEVEVRHALDSYWRKPRVVILAMLCSLAIHFIQAWIHVLLGHALDAEIPWSYSFIVYPLVGIFSALPISINGIGLREGGYLFLLRGIGMSPEKAVAFGLLWFIIVALESLLGGLLFIVTKSRRPSAVAPDIEDHVR